MEPKSDTAEKPSPWFAACMERYEKYHKAGAPAYLGRLMLRASDPRYEGLRFTDALHPLSTDEALEGLAAAGIEVEGTKLDPDDFLDFYLTVNYPERFPKYAKQYVRSLTRKALEHYVSFVLLKPRPNEVFLDVAASSSPVRDILIEHFNLTEVYRHDANFDAAPDRYTLISMASAIPLPDASVDVITLHNAWEHFEGEEDRNFVREAARLLKPGGRLAILPLELNAQTEILTSPLVWTSKYRRMRSLPEFDPRARILVNEKKLQRQEKFFSPADLAADLAPFAGTLKATVHHFENLSPDRAELETLFDPRARSGVLSGFAEFVLVLEKL